MSAAAAADGDTGYIMKGAASAAPSPSREAANQPRKMKVRNTQPEKGSMQMRHVVGIALAVALFAAGISAAPANPAPPASARSEDSVSALALQWFLQMEAGQIDRAQLTPRYSAQLTDDAVRAMSHELKRYGASPTGAQVLRTSASDDQTIYLVKLLFPRGDAAAMLLGFNTEGKVTGVDIISMAGD